MSTGLFSRDVLISDVRFRSERRFVLGRGSDAVVYRGTWYGAPVAVKVLHDELLDEAISKEGRDALLRLFDHECQRLRRLRHPNIVQFLGVGRTLGKVPVLVTELMDTTLLARYKGLPPLTRLRQFSLLRDTLAGLSYIHSEDIIHRDLTPKNVLVTKEGRAKVADIGVARSLHGDRPGDGGMTQAPGTLLYMPPEALSPQPTYDQRLDVFSYGVLMMSLILRREPSSDLLFSSREEIGPDGRLRAIPEVIRRAQDLQDIGVDHPLHRLIIRCLENNSEDRPKSSALYKVLERIHLHEEETSGSSEEVLQPHSSVDRDLAALKAERDQLLLEKEGISLQRDDALRQRDNLLQLQEDLSREQSLLRTQIEQRDDELRRMQVQQQSHPTILIPQRAELSITAAVQFSASLHMYQQAWSVTYRLENLRLGKNVRVDGVFVHHDHLFADLVVDEYRHLCHTTNVQDWHNVTIDWPNLEQDNRKYEVLVSRFRCHNDLVYLVGVHYYTEDDSTEIWLWKLAFTDEDYLSAKLELISKCKCHSRTFKETTFSVGDSIIFAGEKDEGSTCTYSTVGEFNMSTGQWVHNSKWPNLPEPAAGTTPIVTSDKVHLIGGIMHKPGSPLVGLSKVYTINLINSQPVGDWYTDDLPETPHARCGAAQIAGHIIVAGGRHPTDSRKPESFHRECYALNPVSLSWLRLPSLPYACSAVELVAFKEQLVAAGGGAHDGRLPSICTWHVNNV